MAERPTRYSHRDRTLDPVLASEGRTEALTVYDWANEEALDLVSRRCYAEAQVYATLAQAAAFLAGPEPE